jgi:hypothetical protein
MSQMPSECHSYATWQELDYESLRLRTINHEAPKTSQLNHHHSKATHINHAQRVKLVPEHTHENTTACRRMRQWPRRLPVQVDNLAEEIIPP